MTNCIKPLATYTCSNSTGTTCTKVAATVYIPSSNTTCAAGEFAVLLQTEKTQYDGDRSLITGLQTFQTNQTTLNTSDASAFSSVNTDIIALKSQMNLIAAGSYVLGAPAVDPARIQAETILFGVVLGAAAVIWGVKRIYYTLTQSNHVES